MITVLVIIMLAAGALSIVFRSLDDGTSGAFHDVTGVRRSRTTGLPQGQRGGSLLSTLSGLCFLVAWLTAIGTFAWIVRQ